MVSPALQCLVGGALVVVGMLVALGLARAAANLFMTLIAVGAVVGAVYAILCGYWVGWGQVILHSLLTGGIAAVVCLPALPFSSFFNKRK